MEALTEQNVARYLRENPDFLASWFIDHADDNTLRTLARKLKQDAISLQNSQSPLMPPLDANYSSNSNNSGSAGGSKQSSSTSSPSPSSPSLFASSTSKTNAAAIGFSQTSPTNMNNTDKTSPSGGGITSTNDNSVNSNNDNNNSNTSDNHLLKPSHAHTNSQGCMGENENRDFQKYGTFSKVGRNSITSLIFRKYLDGDRIRRPSVKKDLEDLRRMSEEELFMELIRDIASELDVTLLCHKILQVS